MLDWRPESNKDLTFQDSGPERVQRSRTARHAHAIGVREGLVTLQGGSRTFRDTE